MIDALLDASHLEYRRVLKHAYPHVDNSRLQVLYVPLLLSIVNVGREAYVYLQDRDQTLIEPFSPGHNVVVGRNGSGKSNFFAGE